MQNKEDSNGTINQKLAELIKSGKLQLPEGYVMPEHKGHQGSFTTIREKSYRGKDIRVETTYKITIDGEPLHAHTVVRNDGTVHCHAFPNYAFPSAMELARKIIDSLSIEMPEDQLGQSDTYHHGGND